jgi:cold shock CspA family protein
MKDLVLNGFVKNFAESHAFADDTSSEVFEAFAMSAVLRKFHACDVAEFDEILVGGSTDAGIDGAVILVNGRPVKSKEDLAFFRSRLRHLDFQFVFVQAKTSSEFDSGDIGTFLYGVSQFFSNEPTVRFNAEVDALRKLKDEVYDLSIAMDQNPTCHAYYVSTGTWNDDLEPHARLDEGAERLEATHLFSQVKAVPIDAQTLKSIYRELERGVTREVELSKTAVFPSIDGVGEAYLGLMPGHEFLRLITNEDGDLNRDLFYDNVRDYQGNNPVNTEIATTIAGSTKGRFPLLNNGITIVARSISRTGDKFRISDFQIVNGCQTTHVIHQNRNAIDPTIFVPIKLVVTNDSEIITEVIKATNWQTAVMPEALESLTPLHKEIEDFYNSHQSNRNRATRIFYERRSKQYYFDPIPSSSIVTLTAQTKSFVAMFLNEPHSHPRYYGELLKAYEARIFVGDHNPAIYFASGLAYITVHRFFNQGGLPKAMRAYIYHILMLLRIQLMGLATPRFNSNKMNKYALDLSEKLGDESLCHAECEKAISQIRLVLKGFKESSGGNPPSRLKAFTESLIEATKSSSDDTDLEEGPSLTVGSTETGTLRWFDELKGYGFIQRDVGGDVFVHATGLKEAPWKYWQAGSRFRFKITEGRKGVMAVVTEVLGGSPTL